MDAREEGGLFLDRASENREGACFPADRGAAKKDAAAGGSP